MQLRQRVAARKHLFSVHLCGRDAMYTGLQWFDSAEESSFTPSCLCVFRVSRSLIYTCTEKWESNLFFNQQRTFVATHRGQTTRGGGKLPSSRGTTQRQSVYIRYRTFNTRPALVGILASRSHPARNCRMENVMYAYTCTHANVRNLNCKNAMYSLNWYTRRWLIENPFM